MVYAGVDIAKTDHVIGAVDDAGEQVGRPMPFRNSDAGFERCIAWLESVAEGPEDVFVGMEATGHYWRACFARLVSAGYRVCVVNPMQVHAMRRFEGLAGIKNDSIDSILIANTLRRGNFEQTQLATDDVQSLRQLTRYHQGLKQELATVKTQAICVLDSYFPEYAGLFSDMFGSASLRLLAECPVPSEMARRRTSTIAKLLREGSRGRLGEAKAAEAKAAAKRSVGIRLGEDAAAFQIRCMVSQIEFLESTIDEVEAQIAELLARIEPNITTIPGVGTVTGAQIVAEIGDVKRFRSAASIVKYAGLNSGVDESGEFAATGVPITKHGSPLPQAGDVARCEPRLAVRQEARGVLPEEAGRGQAPPGRRDRRGEEALPHRVCGHARREALRSGQVARHPRAMHPEAFGIRLSRSLGGSGRHAWSPCRKIRAERSAWT